MRSIVDLITDLSSRPHPCLTWYGGENERVDLTGKTGANWIIKAANLLSTELACEPGSKVWLDLPAHWRSLVWAHAAWSLGAEVTFSGEEADIAITATPGDAHTHVETVVIALAALARRVEDLPADAVDGAADLMTQADDFMFPPEGGPDDETGLGLTQQKLLAARPELRRSSTAAAQVGDPDGLPGGRVLVVGASLPVLLSQVSPVWAGGASVVIAGDDSVAEAEGVSHVTRTGAPA
ncbi:MAG TPA: TIGR03089 family protein [Beutenbergiaceae bacterium]|nr:TIGR03089 family protein [Beutenbergiaceae bacterium]